MCGSGWAERSRSDDRAHRQRTTSLTRGQDARACPHSETNVEKLIRMRWTVVVVNALL